MEADRLETDAEIDVLNELTADDDDIELGKTVVEVLQGHIVYVSVTVTVTTSKSCVLADEATSRKKELNRISKALKTDAIVWHLLGSNSGRRGYSAGTV